MKQIEQIKQYAELLRLTQTKKSPEEILHQAQIDKLSYTEFTLELLKKKSFTGKIPIWSEDSN
ncbi:hypothetical protein [Saccharicrinis fermentans]|uniref:hypothetical protein n=1 Tax=Saccharicrinis fermentans TaxID=982 RepID=UPI0004AF65FE|nr:hypothetical protein [Saccharicrinis fermentans]